MLSDPETKSAGCLSSLTVCAAIVICLIVVRPAALLANETEASFPNLTNGGKHHYPGRRVAQLGDRLPLYFIENGGHVDPRVAYYVHASDKVIYFTPDGLTLVLGRRSEANSRQAAANITRHGAAEPAVADAPSRLTVKLDFVQANADVRPIGEDLSAARVSYFKGPSSGWKTGLKTYTRLVYPDLWPGIDLIYSGTASRLKYMFRVKPGSDPRQIQFRYRGADSVVVDRDGRLEVQTALGNYQDDKPSAHQDIDGEITDVSVSYELKAEADGSSYRYGFRIADYDPTKPLIIDPEILVYAGFIGGAGDDRGNAIAVDAEGNAYITGETNSSELTFPKTVGPDLTYNGGVDAFVAKVNAAGTALLYAGYIGGLGDDRGNAIAVDAAGNAYIAGETNSSQVTFPKTVGPDLTYNGGVDAFVAKVNAAGTVLVYAGYIGGLGDDRGKGIAVDAAGNAYITGETTSTQATFPDGDGIGAISGFDETYNGGVDAFVAKVNAAGTALLYASYIGGAGDDRGNAIAVDAAGNAYITGETTSTEVTFPDGNGFGTITGFDTTYNGGVDAFVAKLDAAGTTLTFAAYIGGLGDDRGKGIAVDAVGDIFVTGETDSTEVTFPAQTGPEPTKNLGFDAFAAKICTSACVDLSVTQSHVPDPVRAGDAITYTITVHNSGPGDATGVKLTYTLASSLILVSATPSSGSCTLGAPIICDLGNLANGSSATVTVVATTTVTGTVVSSASVTADQTEIAPGNNTDDEKTVVTLPDLMVPVLKAAAAVIPGDALVINDTTKNNSSIAAGPSTTNFYLSADNKFDPGDVLLGGRSVGALGPKQSSAASTTVTIPPGTALGNYFLLAVADADNVVAETKDKNKKSRKLSVTRPDLTVTRLKSPSSAAVGSTVVINETTSNKTAVSAGSSATSFFLSADEILDGSDTLLAGRAVPVLAPKGSSAAQTTVVIPLSTVPGKYYLIAVCDSADSVVEINEGNNTRSKTITITP